MGPYYAMLSELLSLDVAVVIAHRGGSALRPENTLTAFAHAASLGVDAIECDVRLSADGEPVVIHDETLDRTTNESGPVAARTVRELAAIDAGARFGARDGHPFGGRGVGVPRLAEVLEQSPRLPVVVEIKGSDWRTAERAVAVIREAGAIDRVVIGGFSRAVMERVRRTVPTVPTSASSAEVQSALRRSWFRIAPRRTGYALFQVPVRLRGRSVLTRALVGTARRAGFPVQAWIVDDPDEMRRLLDWGVTGLISDRPDLAIDVVGARRSHA